MRRELNVLVGVCGGIAAYKVAPLVRALRYRGHHVRCVLTRSGEAFVSRLTLEILSGRAVVGDELLEPTGTGDEVHIEAAAWTDVALVAPATANTMARLAAGLADDYLTTTLLAFDGPVLLAPAMHPVMWARPASERVRETLVADGMHLVGPVVGPLANGEVGMGRMAEIEDLVGAVERAGSAGRFRGRRVLVTAGPTHEPLDPIRYLANRSSGKMGFALAEAFHREGAEVILVSGPVSLPTPWGVERIDVRTAREMEEAVRERAAGSDLVFMAAAVADFRPAEEAPQKLKKRAGVPELRLTENRDILATLRDRAPEALLVGFAAETEQLVDNARKKLEAKRVDYVIANDVSRADIGMESDENEVTVIGRVGDPVRLGKSPKERLAEELVVYFANALEGRPS